MKESVRNVYVIQGDSRNLHTWKKLWTNIEALQQVLKVMKVF